MRHNLGLSVAVLVALTWVETGPLLSVLHLHPMCFQLQMPGVDVEYSVLGTCPSAMANHPLQKISESFLRFTLSNALSISNSTVHRMLS